MNKKLLYGKAYRRLENSTPLRFDCGRICRSKCCRGSEDTGMHLYPGEEAMFEKQKDFLTLRDEVFGERNIRFAVCGGRCARKLRPLACRVFPLAPYLSRNGKLHIVEDPRARYICPLLFPGMELKISRTFKRNIYRLFQLLLLDPDIKAYVEALSEVLEEYARYTGAPPFT